MAASVLIGANAIMADTAPVSMKWIMGENGARSNCYSVRVVLKNISDKNLDSNWTVGFNAFDRKIEAVGEAAVQLDKYPPNYLRITPNANYKTLAPGDSIVADYLFRGQFGSVCYFPDGAHFIANGDISHPIGMKIDIPVMNNPAQWSTPGKEFANYPDGKYVYGFNKLINPEGAKLQGSVYENIFPSPKSVNIVGGVAVIPANVSVLSGNAVLKRAESYLLEKLAWNGISNNKKSRFRILLNVRQDNSKNSEQYELVVSKNSIVINGNSEAGVFNAIKTLVAAIELNGGVGSKLACAVINDYPDLEHRGMMLDIARNYTKLENVRRLIDLLASYKINIFHFHIADDEAWRLEIPGLPELTDVGSRKGCDLNETESLLQTYSGNGNPDDPNTPANGFITRSQFIDLLKYARNRGVEIIPEIDTPGHSRAAIISMKARYRKYVKTNRTEAERYKIWDDDDTSSYYGAQGYGDNVLNVALSGTYNFMQKVFDEIRAMYEDAGVQLRIFHFGGDEVARGALEGSPIAKKFMAENGMETIHELSEYYIDKMSKYISSKGVLCGGWQEVALKHSDDFNKRVAPRFGMINAWSTNGRSDTVPYTIANDNYPVVMSNVANFYLDMVYTRHQCEKGLSWGGWCNEFTSWSAQPFNSYRSAREDWNGNPVNLAKIADGKPSLINKKNIKGVQGQLWAETVRDFNQVQMHVFPKILGLAERGWNVTPSWSNDYADMSRYNKERVQYNLRIGELELPRLNRHGANFHINQPGIIVEDGMIKANTCYPDMVVRYTLDGSEPTVKSPIWTAPVSCGDAKLIKAKAYYLGKESVTTFFFNK